MVVGFYPSIFCLSTQTSLHHATYVFLRNVGKYLRWKLWDLIRKHANTKASLNLICHSRIWCLNAEKVFGSSTLLGFHQARAPGEDGIVYIHACLSDIMKLQIIAHQLRSPKCCSCSQGPGVTFAGTATIALWISSMRILQDLAAFTPMLQIRSALRRCPDQDRPR